MHQIQYLLGLRPRPRLGDYNAPSDSTAVFTGQATFKGRKRNMRGEEAGEKRRERGGGGGAGKKGGPGS